MKIDSFYYDTRVNLSATAEEIDYMIACSRSHYDWACKDASGVSSIERGIATKNGFLTVWKMFHKDSTQELTLRELDLLCKIVENGEKRDFYYELRKILREVGDKACEVNGRPKRDHGPILHPSVENKLCKDEGKKS